MLKDFRGSSHRILASWLAGLPAGARVLELGASSAQLARLVRRPDLHWVGLEASLDCLAALRSALTAAVLTDLEALRALPRGFDAVLAADVLEHLNHPEEMLRRIFTTLPAGGTLLLSVPNVANLYVRLSLLGGCFPYADRGILDRTHRIFFTRRSIRELVERAGFTIERVAASTIPLPLALPHLPAVLLAPLARALELLTALRPSLLGYQILLRARRL